MLKEILVPWGNTQPSCPEPDPGLRLTHLLVPGVGYTNFATGNNFTNSGNLSSTYSGIRPSAIGTQRDFHPNGGTNGPTFVRYSVDDTISKDFTFVWAGTPLGSFNGNIFTRGLDGSGNGWNIHLIFNTDGSLTGSVVDTVPTSYSVSTTATADVFNKLVQRVAIRRRGPALEIHHLNSGKVASTTIPDNSLRVSGVGVGLASRPSGDSNGHQSTGILIGFNHWIDDVLLYDLLHNPYNAAAAQRIVVPVVTSIQVLKPTSDISAGVWTPSTGTTLYGVLDEPTPNDADYITTTSASTAEVALSSGTDPVVSTGHIIRYRAKSTGTLTVELVQGTTVIASHVPAITTAFQLFTWTLSGAEANSITNYSDLRLRFISS